MNYKNRETAQRMIDELAQEYKKEHPNSILSSISVLELLEWNQDKMSGHKQ